MRLPGCVGMCGAAGPVRLARAVAAGQALCKQGQAGRMFVGNPHTMSALENRVRHLPSITDEGWGVE